MWRRTANVTRWAVNNEMMPSMSSEGFQPFDDDRDALAAADTAGG